MGVSNAKQHSELLWHRGRVARAVVEALTASGVKLVVCTHAVKVSRLLAAELTREVPLCALSTARFFSDTCVD